MPTVSNSRKQNGVVLIVAMVLLLIMTMVGVSAMRSSITNERMASALKNPCSPHKRWRSGVIADGANSRFDIQ